MTANPILTGFHPDPSITRAGDDFFLATSTFEYFPGVPIYHSKDLQKWTLIGHALTRPSQICIRGGTEPGGGVWAPTLRHHNGVFYLATCSFDQFRPQQGQRLYPRGFYVKTQNIWDSSSWSDPVFFDSIGFDQDLFWDDDGSVYLSTTQPRIDRPPPDNHKLDVAIHVCQVDLATGNALSQTKMIRASPSGIAEGSHLFRRGSFHYLLTAEGGTGAKHSECVHRSAHGVFGPWVPAPNNPVLSSSSEDDTQNTGHVDLVEDTRGQWWAVLLGVRPVRTSAGTWQESVFGRETFLVPVAWVDDWPVLNGGQNVRLGQEQDAVDSGQVLWRDDFSARQLKLGWYRKNTPQKTDYELLRDPHRLCLHGGPYAVGAPACPTLFLQKQKHRAGVWSTRLAFHPEEEREEAGALVWWNHTTYSSIGIRKACNTTNGRVIRFRNADGDIFERSLQCAGSDVVLSIQCSDERYTFGFREVPTEDEATGGDEKTEWLGSVTNKVMTRPPPVGLAFTGMLLGVYAYADNRRATTPACFYYAEFRR